MVSVVMFLCGVGVGACAVWALVSYTAVNPMPSGQPEEAVPVQSIIDRLERERLATRGSAAGPARSRGSGEPRLALRREGTCFGQRPTATR